MEKSILSKPMTDRLLRNMGVWDSLRVDSQEQVLCSKTFSSVRYLSSMDGDPTELVVTVDVTVRDTLRDFGLVLEDYTQDSELDGFIWSTGEVGEHIVAGGHYLLPIYVFETYETERIEPGSAYFGELRGQCEYAMALWRDADAMTFNVKPEFGYIEAARAFQFWEQVTALDSLVLLHPLAEYCLSYDDNLFIDLARYEGDGGVGEYTPYIPNLRVPGFCVWDETIHPYDAVKSLALHGIESKKALYARKK